MGLKLRTGSEALRVKGFRWKEFGLFSSDTTIGVTNMISQYELQDNASSQSVAGRGSCDWPLWLHQDGEFVVAEHGEAWPG